MNKTFSQVITDKTEQVVYQGTAVASDSDTKSVLYDWLQFREINDENEDKFLVYYRRNLDMFYPKYLLLLEDELKDIPQLDNFRSEITGQLRNYGSITDEIVRSIERENQRTDNLTRTTDMTTKDTGTIGNSETDVLTGSTRNDNQLNQNVTASSTSNSSDESSSHTEGETHNEGKDRMRGLMRQLPQSTEYNGGFDSNGYPINFEWGTATSQAEDLSENEADATTETDVNASSSGETSSTNQSNTTNTGYTTGSSNQTNTFNKTQTNNTQSKDEGTVKDTGTQTMNEGVDENASNTRRLDDKHDTFSTEHGFKGMTEAEIRLKIWDYISNSIALQWFLGKMERCFIGVFE